MVFKCAYLRGFATGRKRCRFGAGIALASTLIVAGCATRAPTYVKAPVYQPPSQDHSTVMVRARVAGYRQQGKVEIEDDGIEAQSPPPALARKREADDPTEPFSPNYGRYTQVKKADANSAAVYIPNDLPAEFKDKLGSSASGT